MRSTIPVSIAHPSLRAEQVDRLADEPVGPVQWPFYLTLIVTYVTSFVVLPGPPVFRIVPTAAFLLIGIMRTASTSIGRVRFDPWLVVLMVWSVSSLMWTIDRGQTLQQLFREYSRVAAVTIAISLLGYHRSKRSVRILMQVAVVAMFIYWALRPSASSLPLEGDTETGLRGFFGHKNTLAKVMLLSILGFAADRSLGKKAIPWILAAAVLLRFSTATTALFAALAGLGVYWIVVLSERLDRRGKTSLRVLSLVVGGMIIALTIAFSLNTVIQATGKDSTLTGRTEIWKVSVPFARAEPVFGYGFGAIWESEQGPGPEINRLVGDFPVVDAHNTFLEQVLQVGTVGVLIMAGWALSTVRRAARALPTRPKEAAWIIASTIALTILGISDAVFLGWLSWYALLSAMSYELIRGIDAKSNEAAKSAVRGNSSKARPRAVSPKAAAPVQQRRRSGSVTRPATRSTPGQLSRAHKSGATPTQASSPHVAAALRERPASSRPSR